MRNDKGLVLIADDEPNIVLLLRRMFERDGFTVENVADGNSALQKAEQLRPDLILMDVMMPGINGFEVVRLLRQNEATSRIPTIFITAAAREPADVARGLGLGADDYVTKPFNQHELLARAHSKLRARRLEEDLERRNKELEALVQIGREFNQRLKLDELLDLVLSVCVSNLQATQALLCLFDAQGAVSLWRTHNAERITQNYLEQAVGNPMTLLGRLLREDQSIHISDVEGTIIGDYCHSVVATRIIHHGAVIGAILVGHTDPAHYDAGHLRLLESITEQATLAIRNAELYDELHHYALNLENMVIERTTELQSAQSQLIRSEKLASLGRLAAGIAHEVNNPLQAIRNCLELAIEDLDAQRPVDKELLTVAEQDVQRIKRIISQLLDFSRPGTGDLRLMEPGQAVQSVLHLVSRQLERGKIELVMDIGRTSLIRINEDQFKQVVLNLVLNALEAMPDGGTLTVKVWESDTNVYVCFSDTGIGIPEANLTQIFDPFFSTKADGTGLGLAVSYGIIEGLGGRIEVTSESNRGSTFTVALPREP